MLGLPQPGLLVFTVSEPIARGPTPPAAQAPATDAFTALMRSSRTAFRHTECLTSEEVSTYLQPGSSKGQLAQDICQLLSEVGAGFKADDLASERKCSFLAVDHVFWSPRAAGSLMPTSVICF